MPISSRWPHPLRALRLRNFRLFWFGQLISLSGSWMQLIALSWLVYRLTDSPLMLGLTNFVALLPVGLVSLLGGVISDRFPRRKLLLVTQTTLAVQALILIILTWAGWIQVWHIMVVMFVIGAANTLEQPARVAFLMEIVGKEDLPNAIGLNASVANLARSLGPVIAGILIDRFGETSCFLVNFVTYLAIILAFLSMRLPARVGLKKPMRLKGDLLDGLKYIWKNQAIKGPLILIGASSILAQPYIVLMPVFARDVLQADSRVYGLLMSAIGFGAVCGALVAASVKQGQLGKWLVGVALVFPAFLLLFAFSQQMWLSVGLLLLVGASQLTQQVLANSLIQLAAIDEFQGRVASFFALFNIGLIRLGGLQAGAVAQYWSVPVAIAGGAIATIIWVLMAIWRMPIMRQVQ